MSLNRVYLLVIVGILFGSCGKDKTDLQPQLPSYLRVPATLTGYVGSGRIAVNGGLSLVAEGPEAQDANTKTYTVGQPRTFAESYAVPAAYQSNGKLLVINAIDPGTYPMGFETKPTPTGAQADLILNLPGPQLYQARSGTLTISESTLVKAEGQNKLYRLQGTFQSALFGTGVGTSSTKDYAVTGTFDLLLVE